VGVDGLLFSLIAPAVPRLADRYDLFDAEVAFVFAAFPAAMLIAAVVGVGLVERIGERNAMLLGGGLLVVATIAFAIAPGALGLLLARALQGVGGGLAWTAAIGGVAGAFPAEQRGVRLAALESAAGGSGLVAPVIGGVALDRIGLQATFLAAAALATLALAPVWIMRDVGARVTVSARGIIAVLERPAARAGVVATVVVGGVLALLEPLLPLDLDERLGLSATGIGLVFAAGSGAYLVGAPIMGRVSDRRGRRGPLVAGLLGTALALPLMAVGPIWVPVLAFVVVGFGPGAAIGPTGALISQRVDEADPGGAYGLGGALLVFVFATGYLVGPVFGGVASLGLPFLAVLSIAAAAILLAATVCDRLLAAPA